MKNLKPNKSVGRCVLIMLVIFFAFTTTPAHATPDFMPLEEIKTGMRGIAKTVVSGNNIEEFGIEVIGVMKEKGPVGDLILVRTFGDVIERTGGIAQGMSGSPVYINNKLIGAIAYGWALTDHKTGMVTPIADMLKLWDMPDVFRGDKIEEQATTEKSDEADDEKTEDTKEENEGIKPKDKKPAEEAALEQTEENDEDENLQKNTDENMATTEEDENIVVEEKDENIVVEEKDESIVVEEEDENIVVEEKDESIVVEEKDESIVVEEEDESIVVEEEDESIVIDESNAEVKNEQEKTEDDNIDENENDKKGEMDNHLLKDDEGNGLLKFGDNTLFIPKSSKLMATGFSPQALKLLERELKPYGLSLESGANSTNTQIAYITPEPGSMVGAELIRGDVNLSSLGTVTYVRDNKILAFGHPFMKRGNVNYFLSEASVYTTLSGLENSFKVGSSGSAIGLVNQDRGAGIAGLLGVFPRIVPLRIAVHDKTLGITRQMSAQLAHDEDITPILSAATIFSAMEKTSDRVGSGTATVKFDITAQGLPIDKLERENMFYSNSNISEIAVSEVFEAISILTGNQYNSVNIIDVKVDIAMEKERRTASIMEAKSDKKTVKPGEEVDVTVKLKPYRQEPINRRVSFIVPKDQPAGSMMVSVRGGGVVSLTQLLKRAATETSPQESLAKLIMGSRAKPKTFEEAIKNLTERDRYNDIVLEILNMDMDETSGKNKEKEEGNFNNVKQVTPKNFDNTAKEVKSKKPGLWDEEENKRKFNISTDYIVDSETQFVVEVVK